jgi:hypothetical protein
MPPHNDDADSEKSSDMPPVVLLEYMTMLITAATQKLAPLAPWSWGHR